MLGRIAGIMDHTSTSNRAGDMNIDSSKAMRINQNGHSLASVMATMDFKLAGSEVSMILAMSMQILRLIAQNAPDKVNYL